MSPSGARKLAGMRFAGKRPPAFIVVTEATDIAANARKKGFFVLGFDARETYEWRVLHRLDVAVVTRLDRTAIAPICTAILGIEPRSFQAAYYGRHETEYDCVIPYGTH